MEECRRCRRELCDVVPQGWSAGGRASSAKQSPGGAPLCSAGEPISRCALRLWRMTHGGASGRGALGGPNVCSRYQISTTHALALCVGAACTNMATTLSTPKMRPAGVFPRQSFVRVGRHRSAAPRRSIMLLHMPLPAATDCMLIGVGELSSQRINFDNT
ncbi:hypothetical protein K491DRAFT_201025 [Lophiostoma macrostomum CBS 122681]|uniref:Uncharacterized protein n=1 Tax=Lophiostoma macrostomum CBS 122681 TaxID=1314788 RepID=A0A6A6SPE0_9PLEO|nr:hypothetical protein K491DRAFT_201025 [Lophiostoma macrostomum CBS 122681]